MFKMNAEKAKILYTIKDIKRTFEIIYQQLMQVAHSIYYNNPNPSEKEVSQVNAIILSLSELASNLYLFEESNDFTLMLD
ncbi:MAG TPA: hypothetical protein DDY71_09960 [Spirochaetia bacterium]|nr:hypothetical protein [Spirochaetia bacterium]